MSELSNVRLTNLEDDLRKIAKVTRSTRNRVRAAKEDTSRNKIIGRSKDFVAASIFLGRSNTITSRPGNLSDFP